MNKYTWLEFEKEWGAKFNNAHHILCFINSFPKSKLNLLGIEFESSEKLIEIQKEWLWLLNNLTHLDDTSFFKPYWVPIEKNSVSYFIDLSAEDYSLFKTHFFPFDIEWYKTYYTENINELMIALSDTDKKIEQFRLRSQDENEAILSLIEKKYTNDED